MKHVHSEILALALALPALLTGCDVKGGLSAYLHKTDATPEPPATAAPPVSGIAVAASPIPQSSARYVGSAAQPSSAPPSALAVTRGKPISASASVSPASSALANAQSAPSVLTAPAAAHATAPSSAPLATAAPAAPPPIPQVKTTGHRNVSVGGAAVSGGNVSNAARVIAGLRKPLRDCYSRDSADTEGSVRFTIKVGPTGAVSSVNAQPGSPFSSQLMACTTAVIRAAKFDPPENGAAQVMVPASFVID